MDGRPPGSALTVRHTCDVLLRRTTSTDGSANWESPLVVSGPGTTCSRRVRRPFPPCDEASTTPSRLSASSAFGSSINWWTKSHFPSWSLPSTTKTLASAPAPCTRWLVTDASRTTAAPERSFGCRAPWSTCTTRIRTSVRRRSTPSGRFGVYPMCRRRSPKPPSTSLIEACAAWPARRLGSDAPLVGGARGRSRRGPRRPVLHRCTSSPLPTWPCGGCPPGECGPRTAHRSCRTGDRSLSSRR